MAIKQMNKLNNSLRAGRGVLCWNREGAPCSVLSRKDFLETDPREQT